MMVASLAHSSWLLLLLACLPTALADMDPSECGVATCTFPVWFAKVGPEGLNCGQRIVWYTGDGRGAAAACATVAQMYADCEPCDPDYAGPAVVAPPPQIEPPQPPPPPGPPGYAEYCPLGRHFVTRAFTFAIGLGLFIAYAYSKRFWGNEDEHVFLADLSKVVISGAIGGCMLYLFSLVKSGKEYDPLAWYNGPYLVLTLIVTFGSATATRLAEMAARELHGKAVPRCLWGCLSWCPCSCTTGSRLDLSKILTSGKYTNEPDRSTNTAVDAPVAAASTMDKDDRWGWYFAQLFQAVVLIGIPLRLLAILVIVLMLQLGRWSPVHWIAQGWYFSGLSCGTRTVLIVYVIPFIGDVLQLLYMHKALMRKIYISATQDEEDEEDGGVPYRDAGELTGEARPWRSHVIFCLSECGDHSRWTELQHSFNQAWTQLADLPGGEMYATIISFGDDARLRPMYRVADEPPSLGEPKGTGNNFRHAAERAMESYKTEKQYRPDTKTFVIFTSSAPGDEKELAAETLRKECATDPDSLEVYTVAVGKEAGSLASMAFQSGVQCDSNAKSAAMGALKKRFKEITALIAQSLPSGQSHSSWCNLKAVVACPVASVSCIGASCRAVGQGIQTTFKICCPSR